MDWVTKLQKAAELNSSLSAVERFEESCARLAEKQPGSGRNTELNKVAFIGGTLINAGKAQEWWVRQQLREACETNGYIKDDGESTFTKTMESGLNNGKQVEPEHDNPIYKLAIPASRLANIPKARWLVKDVLKQNTTAFIISEPGVGKSFMALDLAAHIADQEHWHGRAIQANGKVVYITPEGASDLDFRRVAWEKHNNRTMSDDVIFFAEPINIGSRKWAYFADYCEDIKPAVIIVDTLARNTPGQDEVKDMGPVVACFDELRARTNCTVVVVHHVNKAFGEMRGSSELDGAADTIIKLAKPDPTLPIMNAWITKQKNGAQLHLGKFKLEVYKVAEDETSVAFTPIEAIPWNNPNRGQQQ